MIEYFNIHYKTEKCTISISTKWMNVFVDNLSYSRCLVNTFKTKILSSYIGYEKLVIIVLFKVEIFRNFKGFDSKGS
ncbi:hypothetical protein BJV40_003637 [Clostridium beijerinckii]|nr:hypothetical protein [Clostridium beijerinckii]